MSRVSRADMINHLSDSGILRLFLLTPPQNWYLVSETLLDPV